ncbi:MAG: radical SAM/SPASM domain-containing protein [Desulfuromonadales bacterium]
MSEAVSYLDKKRPWEKDRPRCHLAECLPLETPLSLQIDPSNLCNFRCRFCPTGHPDLLNRVGRSKGQLMSWELYEKLVAELAAFPQPLKTLSLHKDGEPLLNPRIADMVSLARKRNVAEKIVLLTNASLLTREMAIDLITAGLDAIRISVEHVSVEGYRAYTQVYDDYDKIVSNIRILSEERDRFESHLFISAKLIDFGLSRDDLEIFAHDFSTSCDEISRTTAQGWSHSEIFDFTLGSNPTASLDGQTPLNPKRIACPFPFYMMAVNANGLVSPCPDDWTHKAVIGNANTETLQEIWNGLSLREFRQMHLSGKRGCNVACANCHCIQGIPEDSDLDESLEQLSNIFAGTQP